MKTKTTTIINLTPHEVSFVDAEGTIVLSVEPSGTVARVSSRTVQTGTLNGLPVTQTEFGEVQDLPEQKDGTVYLVSSLVAQRVPERRDVFIPAESVRDSAGRIIGCRSLGRI